MPFSSYAPFMFPVTTVLMGGDAYRAGPDVATLTHDVCRLDRPPGRAAQDGLWVGGALDEEERRADCNEDTAEQAILIFHRPGIAEEALH